MTTTTGTADRSERMIDMELRACDVATEGYPMDGYPTWRDARDKFAAHLIGGLAHALAHFGDEGEAAWNRCVESAAEYAAESRKGHVEAGRLTQAAS